MRHRSGWARWRRAKHGNLKALRGHARRVSSPGHGRRPDLTTDAERARLRSERARVAAELDLELRLLCRGEAAMRRELGCAAQAMVRQHAYRRLGFVRLSDYARERLGLSARTVQSAAWLAARLDALPAVSTAFDRSEISWTQARVVCAVASAADEERWLGLARRCPIATLAELVKRAEAPGDIPADPDAETHEIDGEPAVRWRLACPARVRALWRHALELASRLAGGPLADWRAAEIIAAEGFSGRPAGASMGERTMCVARRRARVHAATSAPRGGAQGVAPAGDRDVAAPDPSSAPAACDAVAAAAAGAMARGAAIAPTDPFALDGRLRRARRELQTLDARIGRLLRVLVDHHFYRLLGFRSVDAYVRERLGLSTRKAWALLKLEQATLRSDELARVYADGSLSWARALTLLPVLERANAAAWIARAQAVTVRRLGDEVNHVLEAHDARGASVTLDPPLADDVLTSPVATLLHAERGDECRKMSLATGVQTRAHDPAVPPEGHAGVQIGARAALAVAAAWRAAAEVCDAAVSFTGPASVVALLRDVMDAFAVPGAPRWVAFERLLRHAITHWERTPRHRDPIFARDGWRCTVPACSGRRNLHDHHLVYRGRGGGHEQTNRVAVCAAHHLHGVHTGVIRS